MQTNEQAVAYVQKLAEAAHVVENLSSGPLLMVALIAFGYFLKWIPAFPNKYIPMTVVIIGPLVYPFLVGKDTLGKWESPVLVSAIYGFIFAVLAYALHHFVLWHLEKKFVDWLESKGIVKPKSEPPQPPTQDAP